VVVVVCVDVVVFVDVVVVVDVDGDVDVIESSSNVREHRHAALKKLAAALVSRTRWRRRAQRPS
jgi:hypothetical protein